MSKISEHIFRLYSQLVGDEIQPIDENVVDEAMDVINKINVTDANSLFYFLSAINLEEFYKLKYCSTVVYMVPRA